MTGFSLPAFYPILDTAIVEAGALDPIAAAEAILEAGAKILQFRHKEFFSRKHFEQAAQIAGLCRSNGALFVLNDRADFAVLLEAALHLGQDDLDPSDARKLLPRPAIIGFSTHNREQLRAADAKAVDYLAIGPIFATGSKKNPDPVVGGAELSKLRSLTQKPLVGIGGITRETAPEVLEAGADSVAVIGDLYPKLLTKAELRKRAEEWIAICAGKSKKPE